MKLVLGDSIEYMEAMSDESVDLLLTDPPYSVITGGNNHAKNVRRPTGCLTSNSNLMREIPAFKDWLGHCFRVLKDGTHAYFMVNYSNLIELHQAVTDAGFKVHNLLVWRKNNNTPSQYYMKNCEYVIFARKGKAKYINNIGASKTVHDFNNVTGREHPTQKPVDLMQFYIENSSNVGDLIFDPFMGSGSTGVAAIKSGRDFLGIELFEDYYEIATKRIEDALR